MELKYDSYSEILVLTPILRKNTPSIDGDIALYVLYSTIQAYTTPYGLYLSGFSEDYLTLAVEACKLVRSRLCGTSQIWAWEWWDRKVNIISSDAAKRPHIIPLWMFVAYGLVDLGKSREYNDNWPSQEGHDDFQDVYKTREKCMIRYQHMI